MKLDRKAREVLKKWRFAIGTTSRVPGKPGWHYLILDIDGEELPAMKEQEFWFLEYRAQKTPNGWHIYTPRILRFKAMLRLARKYGADKAWIRIARKRGYAFLADKQPIYFTWPVERMIVGINGKKEEILARMG